MNNIGRDSSQIWAKIFFLGGGYCFGPKTLIFLNKFAYEKLVIKTFRFSKDRFPIFVILPFIYFI